MASGKTDRRVQLADKRFDNRDALVVYFRSILRGNKKDYMLSKDEEAVARALLEYHPNKAAKIGTDGISFIKIGNNPKFPDTPSFMVMQNKSNALVDFSYLKVADLLFPEEGKEHAIRKKPMSDVLARVSPVSPGCEKVPRGRPCAHTRAVASQQFLVRDVQLQELKKFVEMSGGASGKRDLAREPIPDGRGGVVLQFADPDDLSALIAGPGLTFKLHQLTIEMLKEVDQQKYWEDRKFERQEKRDAKHVKEQKRAMRGRGRGRGGFGGRGGGCGGGGGSGGCFKCGEEGHKSFECPRAGGGGGGYGGAKRYGDDSGHNDGPGAKRTRY